MSALDKRAWELVTKVPAMKTIPGYACALANLLVSGLGTLGCAFMSDRNVNKTQLFVALMQFLTAPYLLGYLLSIYWAYLIVKKVNKKDGETD